jgi:putative phosphoesterase
LIAIVADTHLPRGSRRLPEAAIERLRSADQILHAGDLSSVAALQFFRSLGPPLSAVCGNADSDELRAALPDHLELEFDGLLVGLLHDAGPATGRLRRLERRFPEADAVVFGHSHIPLHEARGRFQIFNPGSATDRRRQPQHTMGIARIARGRITFEHLALGR